MRYYFDIRVPDGIAIDFDGVQLPDDHAALRNAAAEAYGLVFDAFKTGEQLLAKGILVKDEAGRFLGEVIVAATSILA
jgi:hypothetical protein